MKERFQDRRADFADLGRRVFVGPTTCARARLSTGNRELPVGEIRRRLAPRCLCVPSTTTDVRLPSVLCRTTPIRRLDEGPGGRTAGRAGGGGENSDGRRRARTADAGTER